jgi:hypothetical protein
MTVQSTLDEITGNSVHPTKKLKREPKLRTHKSEMKKVHKTVGANVEREHLEIVWRRFLERRIGNKSSNNIFCLHNNIGTFLSTFPLFCTFTASFIQNSKYLEINSTYVFFAR